MDSDIQIYQYSHAGIQNMKVWFPPAVYPT